MFIIDTLIMEITYKVKQCYNEVHGYAHCFAYCHANATVSGMCDLDIKNAK